MEEYLLTFLPEKVVVNHVTDITNTYKKKPQQNKSLAGQNTEINLKDSPTPPLFSIDLIKTLHDEEFLYSVQPMNFVKMIISLFEKGKQREIFSTSSHYLVLCSAGRDR